MKPDFKLDAPIANPKIVNWVGRCCRDALNKIRRQADIPGHPTTNTAQYFCFLLSKFLLFSF